MKLLITLAIIINLFTNFSFKNNILLSNNETSTIPKIMDSIKEMFNIGEYEKNKIIVLDESKTNKINVDDLIVTKLETDNLEGFFWKYEVSEPDLLNIIFNNYIPGKDIKSGPGNETFIFNSLAKGKCQLTFTYHKEGEDSSLKSVIYNIIIR